MSAALAMRSVLVRAASCAFIEAVRSWVMRSVSVGMGAILPLRYPSY
jgi:hypothetical protein